SSHINSQLFRTMKSTYCPLVKRSGSFSCYAIKSLGHRRQVKPCYALRALTQFSVCLAVWFSSGFAFGENTEAWRQALHAPRPLTMHDFASHTAVGQLLEKGNSQFGRGLFSSALTDVDLDGDGIPELTQTTLNSYDSMGRIVL